MPLPVKPESVPPETVTSGATKLVDASLRLKVRVAVCPALSESWLAVNEIVGGEKWLGLFEQLSPNDKWGTGGS